MVVTANFCQLLLGVQTVREVLCCPGSRYKHKVRKDTALQLSEKKKTQKFTLLVPGKTLSGSLISSLVQTFSLSARKIT